MAEYLSEEEQLAQLKGWWRQYGWWIVAGAVLGLGGYFYLQHHESADASLNAAASEVFERYQQNPSDDAAAGPLLDRLDGEFAGTAYQIMSLMTRAQLATEASDIEAAVGFYSRATSGAEVEHLTDVARLRLARALQQQNRADEAITALGAVKGEGYRSLVAELKGDILQAKGDTSGARDAYAAAVAALGDNPRTLLSMKLANLSAPDGVPAAGESAAEEQEAAVEEGNDIKEAMSEITEELSAETPISPAEALTEQQSN